MLGCTQLSHISPVQNKKSDNNGMIYIDIELGQNNVQHKNREMNYYLNLEIKTSVMPEWCLKSFNVVATNKLF